MLSKYRPLYNSPDSIPYTFSPLYVLSPVSMNAINFLYLYPKRIPCPFFFVHNIPKENPLRHRGIPPLQGSISMLSKYRPLYNSPDSIPYTLSSLYVLSPVSMNAINFLYLYPKRTPCPFSSCIISPKKTL